MISLGSILRESMNEVAPDWLSAMPFVGAEYKNGKLEVPLITLPATMGTCFNSKMLNAIKSISFLKLGWTGGIANVQLDGNRNFPRNIKGYMNTTTIDTDGRLSLKNLDIDAKGFVKLRAYGVEFERVKIDTDQLEIYGGNESVFNLSGITGAIKDVKLQVDEDGVWSKFVSSFIYRVRDSRNPLQIREGLDIKKLLNINFKFDVVSLHFPRELNPRNNISVIYISKKPWTPIEHTNSDHILLKTKANGYYYYVLA